MILCSQGQEQLLVSRSLIDIGNDDELRIKRFVFRNMPRHLDFGNMHIIKNPLFQELTLI